MTRVARATAGERCPTTPPERAGGQKKTSVNDWPPIDLSSGHRRSSIINNRVCHVRYSLEYFWQSLRPVALIAAAGSQPLPGRKKSIRVTTDSPPSLRPSDLSV